MTPNLPDDPARALAEAARSGRDLTPDPTEPLLPGRDPIHIVKGAARRRLTRARAYHNAWETPGRATGLARTTASIGHLFRVVFSRYLLASVILAVAVWALTGVLWLVYVAAGLPILVFLWYGNHVRKEARDYRRGLTGPPPGYLGKL